jgi:hypothetical protein
MSKKHTNIEKNEDNDIYKFICNNCNKKYKSNNGLWRHKKKCKPPKNKPSLLATIENNTREIIEYQAREISNLKELIMKIMEKDPSLISIANSNIYNNKNFNINIFLNQDCKNAKNLIDFINDIPLKLENLKEIDNKGYIEAVKNLLTTELKRYSIYDRPLHYHISDEDDKNKLHIRDENTWKDEQEDVKEIIDKSFYDLDSKIYKFFNKNKLSLPDKNNIFSELSQNGSICKNNEEKQAEVISNIIPIVKIP